MDRLPNLPRWLIPQRAIVLAVVVLVVAATLGMNAYTIHRAAAVQTESAKLELQAQARLVALAHKAWLEEIRGVLASFATVAAELASDPELCRRALAEAVRNIVSIDTLILARADGAGLCAAQPLSPGVSFADRDYFRTALSAPGFATGGILIGRVSGKTALPAALPVLDDRGVPRLMVIAGKQVDWVERLVVQQGQPAGTEVTVTDERGLVLGRALGGGAHHDRAPESAAMAAIRADGREAGVIEAPGGAGEPRYFAYVRLGATGMYAIVSRPRDAALGTVRDFMLTSYVQIAISGALLFLSLWVILGRLVLKPLRTLSEGMGRVAGGDLSWRSRPGKVREMAEISASLNNMLGRLEDTTRQLRAQAETDSLLGIPNRRHFMTAFEREWLRAGRARRPLAVLMIDVDHFKAYNDHYGHPAGDACLRRIAEVVVGVCSRPGDLVGRYGGEEMIVVLPDTDSRGASVVAERVRRAVAATGIPHAASTTAGHVTVSVGLAATTPEPGRTATALIEEADRALYEAKSCGRDRVAV